MIILILEFFIICSISKVRSDCGQAATHPDIWLYGGGATVREGQEIKFECNDNLERFSQGNFRMAYWSSRQCLRGKWNRRNPKCAYLSSINKTEVMVNYPDIDLNETLNKWKEIHFKTTNNLRIKFNFNPRTRISFIELSFTFNPEIDKQLLRIDIFVNNYRHCIVNPLYEDRGKYYLGQFICEAKSYEHYKNETNNLPDSFVVTIKSNETFNLNMQDANVYHFKKDCGTPDLPLFARQTVNDFNWDDNEIFPQNDEKHRKVINGTYSIKCQYEGNFDKQFSEFEPIIQCSVNEFDFNSSHYKSFRFLNFEYFNETLIPVIDSSVQFVCNHSNNTHSAICETNGSWNLVGTKCEDRNQDILIPQTNTSNVSTLVIIILASFLLLLLVLITFVAIFIWRRNASKQLKKRTELSLDENYDDFDHNYANIDQKNVYEPIDYEEVINNLNTYTEIYLDPVLDEPDYVKMTQI